MQVMGQIQITLIGENSHSGSGAGERATGTVKALT